ncbi:hypothetical protein PENTCL1PPCAC_7473, partial [Pristionchus entomophagus]
MEAAVILLGVLGSLLLQQIDVRTRHQILDSQLLHQFLRNLLSSLDRLIVTENHLQLGVFSQSLDSITMDSRLTNEEECSRLPNLTADAIRVTEKGSHVIAVLLIHGDLIVGRQLRSLLVTSLVPDQFVRLLSLGLQTSHLESSILRVEENVDLLNDNAFGARCFLGSSDEFIPVGNGGLDLDVAHDS